MYLYRERHVKLHSYIKNKATTKRNLCKHNKTIKFDICNYLSFLMSLSESQFS